MDASSSETLDRVIHVVSTYGLNVLGAVVILVVGFVAAGWAGRATDRALSRSARIDATIRHFASSFVRYAVIVCVGIAVLDRFGVPTTSFIAVLGAAGLAIGLALQGTLSNIAAGVMLLFFRPFKVGQFIEAGGTSGTVEAITLFLTKLNTPDNVHIVVPNSQLWGTAVKNFSHNATRRLNITVSIDYGDDIGRAFDVIRALIGSDPRVNGDPEPAVMVMNLGESAVDIQFRVWCAASDYWPLRFEFTRKAKEDLEAAGLTIPFPQRTVHQAAAD